MDITYKEIGKGFDDLIAATTRDLHKANRTVGRKIERAGKAAVRKGAPRMWGKKLTVKVKMNVRQVDGVTVYFSGFSAGGWAIQEFGTKAHDIYPTAGRIGRGGRPAALQLFGADFYANNVWHPGAVGNKAWTKAKIRLKDAIDPVIRDAYGDALGA